MSAPWTVLHAGALGDLVLTIQLALRLPGVADNGVLHVLSRTNIGALSACRPRIHRRSSEGLGLHWLFGDHDDPPPQHLSDAIRGGRILSALGGTHTIPHQRLQELAPEAVFSFDPRPHPDLQRHITQQWQTELEQQGLLIPKCVHQRPTQRALGVPDEMRAAGRTMLGDAGCDARCTAIHPGSGGRGKCWPLAAFVDVARQIRRARPDGVCFLIGPVEQETWPAERLAALRDEFPLLTCPGPDELVSLLATAQILIGNDAGPTHLAALLGTPTVTIFGPTAAEVWRPLGPRSVVLEGDPGRSSENWGIAATEVADVASALCG